MQTARASIPADLLTYDEAADLLGITAGSMRSAVATSKRLHPVKLPGIGHKFLRRAEVEAYRYRRRPEEADSQETGPGQTNQASQETLISIVREMLASDLKQAVDMRLTQGINNNSYLQTLLGGQGMTDPKGLLPSSIR